MAAGKFITLEGGEGAGKSTQARLLAERLRGNGRNVVVTREPGGTKKADEIRDFLLSGKARDFGPFAEAILFSAARNGHLEETIRPALKRGAWVVSDRFADSTRAYQGAAGGVKPQVLAALERITVEDTRPDLTIILDLPPKIGLERALETGAADDFEQRDLGFHEALRRKFLDIAADEPERCVVVDAQQPESAVAEDVWEAVVQRLQP